jgi:multiple sugar transport system permease protein
MTTTRPSPPSERTARPGPARDDMIRRGRPNRAQQHAAWLFLAPGIIILAAFTLWPMVQAAYLSFTDYSLLEPARWVGLDNYRRLWEDEAVANAIRNTFVYAVTTTPISVAIALGTAIVLNRRMRLRGFLRTALFLPFVVSLAVVSIAWSFLLDPDIGLLSYWFGKLGLVTQQGWLSDPDYAMPAVVAVGVWKGVGFYMLMYLAGLQSIPRELHEAARVDGASAWQSFRTVTWPLLANQTMLITIIATITNIQVFDQIYVMTQGGPFFRTETLVVLVYRTGFSDLQFGYATAISWVLMFIIVIISALQIVYFRRRAVTY